MSTATPGQVLGPLVTAVDHVGVAVPDLDAAVAFYAETFGLVNVHEEVNEEQGVREAMLTAGDGDTRLQLLAPLRPDSAIGRFLDRSGPGIQQLAFRVDRRRGRRASGSGGQGCGCSTTHPAAARRTPWSTSCTPRTAAACWSSWSSPRRAHP